MRNVLIPIDEHGKGNCCPRCGSKEISVYTQYPLVMEEDLNTGNTIVKDAEGNRAYHPPDKLIVIVCEKTHAVEQCKFFKCRACGWQSQYIFPSS